MNTSTFGERLREYREIHDLSQQDLADILGTTKQVLSRYETGQRDPKLTTVAEYASKLGIPISYFWGDSLIRTKTEQDLTSFEREVLSKLRLLSEDQQRAFLAYLITLLDMQSP